MYKFYLSYNNIFKEEYYPKYTDETNKTSEKITGSMGFIKTLGSKLIFINEDFDKIVSQEFGTKFLVQIDRGIYTNYYNGYFYIQDCTIDYDMKRLEVELTTDDEYTRVLEIFDTEVNIPLEELRKDTIQWLKHPLLQVYVTSQNEGSNAVTNFIGGTSWKQSCTPLTIFDGNDRLDFSDDWSPALGVSDISADRFLYLAEDEISFSTNLTGLWRGVDPDGTGFAVENRSGISPDKYIHDNGLFYLKQVSVTGRIIWKWEIRQTSNDELLAVSNNSQDVSGQNTYFVNNYTFTFTKTTGTFNFTEEKTVCTRLLVTYDMIEYMLLNQNPYYTFKLTHWENPQSFCENEGYNIVINYKEYQRYVETNVSAVTTFNPTIYEQDTDGKYFKQLISDNDYKYIPIGRDIWSNFSVWMRGNETIDELQFEEIEFYNINTLSYDTTYFKELQKTKGYSIETIVQGILDKFGIDLQYKSTFLYPYNNNPITNNNHGAPMFTDVSNVINSQDGDVLSTRSNMSLAQLFQFLNAFDIYWSISDGRFIIEHKYYYDNGGTYNNNEVIGIDYTTLENTRNSLNWSFGTNKISYDLLDWNKYISIEQATASDFFETTLLTQNINSEKTRSESLNWINTDINYLTTLSSSDNDGWFFCFINPSSARILNLKLQGYKGYNYYVQNPYASFPYMNRYYNTYAKQPNTVEVDGVNYNTKGTFRPKLQELIKPMADNEQDADYNKLIKSELGTGRIEEINVNLSERNEKLIIRLS